MSEAELYARLHDVEEQGLKHLESICNIEEEQRLMRSALNDLGRKCGALPTESEAKAAHDAKWDSAFEERDDLEPGPRGKERPVLLARVPEEDTISFRDPDAAFVEQVEVLLNEDLVYVTRLRFDDDTTEVLGTHTLRATALEYATEQARRYRIAIFDSTYEKLVD